MQRNVELCVNDMDKNGVALGILYVGSGARKHSFAVDLVKVGASGRCVHDDKFEGFTRARFPFHFILPRVPVFFLSSFFIFFLSFLPLPAEKCLKCTATCAVRAGGLR